MTRAKSFSLYDIRISLSAEELQGMQSVRATFRLPEHIIKLLNVVAFQLGLKQKSLFDQLIEDQDIVKKIAERMLEQEIQTHDKQRRPKTYVLNRRSLEIIEKLSKELNLSRDLLVEISIQRLLPVLQSEKEKYKNRLIIYKDMEQYLEQGKKLFKKAEHLLGPEDATCEKIKQGIDINERNLDRLRRMIESSRAMEVIEFENTGKAG
jgi:hypothetical protein